MCPRTSFTVHFPGHSENFRLFRSVRRTTAASVLAGIREHPEHRSPNFGNIVRIELGVFRGLGSFHGIPQFLLWDYTAGRNSAYREVPRPPAEPRLSEMLGFRSGGSATALSAAHLRRSTHTALDIFFCLQRIFASCFALLIAR